MQRHIPVLSEAVEEVFRQSKRTYVLDATTGTAGHTERFLQLMQDGILVGVDADSSALEEAKQRLQENAKSDVDVKLLEGNFRNKELLTSAVSGGRYDFILADLGWGSHQLHSGKGFSFLTNEVLNMCYGAEGTCKTTALEIVNTATEEELEEILKTYAEERWAKRIAKHIVEARKQTPVVTAKALADVVSGAIPRALQGKLHPATKTFQALRIVVNDELEALQEFLSVVKILLAEKGTIAIITFHSLEDRIVKQTFKRWEQEGWGKRLQKRGIRATPEECSANPRARSATLRTFTK